MHAQDIIGTWITVGSEIPEHVHGSEAYHFCESGKFHLEFQNLDGLSTINNSRFKVTEDGFRFGSHESLPHKVSAWIEDNHLIMRPRHGMETWMLRVEDGLKPDWIRQHIL